MKTSYQHPLQSLEKKRSTFLNIGLVVSLLMTFLAFEWKTGKDEAYSLPVDQWESIDPEELPVITYRDESAKQELKPEERVTRSQNIFADPVVVPDTKPVDPGTPAPVDTSQIIPIDISPEPEPAPEPVLIPEIMPYFPGGEKALGAFLRDNTRFPDAARKSGIEGLVHISFVIDENGNVTSVKCLRSPGDVLTAEALRVIALMPKWKPGMQGGKKVPVIMTLPINFRLVN